MQISDETKLTAEDAKATIAIGAHFVQRMLKGEVLANILGHSPDSLEALYALGHNFYTHKQYDEAMRVFAFLLSNNHMDRRFFKGMAACLHMQRRYEDAAKYYGAASLLDLSDPEPVVHAAECFLALSRTKEAMQALEVAKQQTTGKDRYLALHARVQTILELIKEKGAQS